jgi:TM2 domain-containing membrane protein YozV
MPNAKPDAPPRAYNPLAGLLSYLVPGLGQVYDGRVVKGLLFFVCIYGLFFYGLHMGRGTVRIGDETYHVSGNVYLPHTSAKNNPWNLQWELAADLYNRPQFVGQFWVGIAAWPAIWQYHQDGKAGEGKRNPDEEDKAKRLFGDFERTPSDEALNAVLNEGDKGMELGWVYTVIAGVLNIMVIYDAFAGPAFLAAAEATRERAA